MARLTLLAFGSCCVVFVVPPLFTVDLFALASLQEIPISVMSVFSRLSVKWRKKASKA